MPRTALLHGVLLLAAAVGVAAAEGVPEVVERELWYQVDVEGTPAGWMTTREGSRGEDLVTESRMHLELTRSTAVVTIDMESRFLESRAGRPIEAWARTSLGSQPLVTSFEFTPEAVVVVSEQAGESRRQEVAWPEGDWLPPAALERQLRERLAAQVETFDLRTVDPLLGMEPVTTRWTLEARGESIVTLDGTYVTSRWRQVPGYAPEIVTVAYVDEEGRLVKSVTPMMGLRLTAVLATRDRTLGTASAAPELLVRSFILSEPIARPRALRRAVYELTTEDGELPELPEVAAQRREIVDGRLRLTVEMGTSPRLDGVDPEAYLRASTYVSHDRPRIRRLLFQALAGRDEATTLERAEALRAFVNGYLVEKDLNTVLATAAEVAETRAGDCTEHAVLLTALLRAAGIPARVVTGLVYVERFAGASRIFGYHMWSQALVDSRWIDFDATLEGTRFDAAHITFSTSSLDDEGTVARDVARLGAILGKLRIDVVEAGY